MKTYKQDFFIFNNLLKPLTRATKAVACDWACSLHEIPGLICGTKKSSAGTLTMFFFFVFRFSNQKFRLQKRRKLVLGWLTPCKPNLSCDLLCFFKSPQFISPIVWHSTLLDTYVTLGPLVFHHFKNQISVPILVSHVSATVSANLTCNRLGFGSVNLLKTASSGFFCLFPAYVSLLV